MQYDYKSLENKYDGNTKAIDQQFRQISNMWSH